MTKLIYILFPINVNMICTIHHTSQVQSIKTVTQKIFFTCSLHIYQPDCFCDVIMITQMADICKVTGMTYNAP